jgi:hypothetical protein
MVLTAAVLSSCADDRPAGLNGANTVQLLDRTAPSALARAGMPALDSLEEAIVESIVSLAPEDQKEAARKVLVPRAGVLANVAQNPREDVEPLLAALTAVRTERFRRGLTIASAVASNRPADTVPYVRVRVALVESLDDSSAVAIVLIRPTEEGIPLLLLPAAATGTDLSMGLRMAAQVSTRVGASDRERRIPFHRQPAAARSAPTVSAYSDRLLAAIRAAPSQALLGVGNARTMDVFTTAGGARPAP